VASLQKRRELAARSLESVRLAAIMEAKKRKDPVLWAQAVWSIRGDTDQPYRTVGFEFMHEIVRQTHPTVTIMAAAGCSKTESFIPYALFKADIGGRILYCFENDTKTGLLVQERVNPNFKSSPYLQGRNQGEVDNIHLKKLGSGMVYFLGLGTDSATRSYHGDEAIFDEYDAMDPLRLIDMRKRLASSREPLIREISNPSQPDYGIHARYKLGDMRRWHLTCEYCGDEHPIDYSTHINRKTLTLQCPCGKPLDRVTRRRWIPSNPKGTHPSYHIHRLMTRVCDVPKLISELGSEDWRTVSAATRMDLGLPYEDKDAGLSDSDLRNVMGDDTWSQYAPGGFISVDPGGVFDVAIFQKVYPGQKPRCTWVGTVKNWAELSRLVEDSQVAGGVIDFGPEQKAAQEFCQTQRGLGRWFVRVAYQLSEGAGQPDWRWDQQDPLLLQANRTGACDTMVMRVRKGEWLFPKRVVIDSLGRWAQHMKSPKRVVEYDERGKAKTRWHHEETRPDHQFHVCVYGSIYLQAFASQAGGRLEVIDKGSY